MERKFLLSKWDVNMKNTKKGVTLIEVIVSIAIFTTISLALFSSVILMKNVIKRQEEYVKIEMICYDIDAYYHLSKKESIEPWYELYFEDIDISHTNKKGYLSSNFKPTTRDNAAYVIEFSQDIILSIYSVDERTIYVENITLSGDK